MWKRKLQANRTWRTLLPSTCGLRASSNSVQCSEFTDPTVTSAVSGCLERSGPKLRLSVNDSLPSKQVHSWMNGKNDAAIRDNAVGEGRGAARKVQGAARVAPRI
ncbi:uncharacterized protein LOC143305580 [Osmia lignaria lignaria]|uniref:uncharacterized protein LOC143305580 n=1 Tax=Osmia lignaria lignaria TaxID=1437193 RepID=UPI00402B2FEA